MKCFMIQRASLNELYHTSLIIMKNLIQPRQNQGLGPTMNADLRIEDGTIRKKIGNLIVPLVSFMVAC